MTSGQPGEVGIGQGGSKVGEGGVESDNRGLKKFRRIQRRDPRGGFASYCIRYEDSRDTVEKLYSNLYLSNIISLESEDGVAEEDVVSAEGRTPTALEVVQISEATPEQRDEGGD